MRMPMPQLYVCFYGNLFAASDTHVHMQAPGGAAPPLLALLKRSLAFVSSAGTRQASTNAIYRSLCTLHLCDSKADFRKFPGYHCFIVALLH